MSDLVREDVGLRELPRRAEALLELIVEAEVDVHLLVHWTVEGSGRGPPEATPRLGRIAEEDELRVVVAGAECLLPRVLGVVEDEGHELDPLLLLGRRLDGPFLLLHRRSLRLE